MTKGGKDSAVADDWDRALHTTVADDEDQEISSKEMHCKSSQYKLKSNSIIHINKNS